MNKIDKLYKDRDKWMRKCLDKMAVVKELKLELDLAEARLRWRAMNYDIIITKAQNTIDELTCRLEYHEDLSDPNDWADPDFIATDYIDSSFLHGQCGCTLCHDKETYNL